MRFRISKSPKEASSRYPRSLRNFAFLGAAITRSQNMPLHVLWNSFPWVGILPYFSDALESIAEDSDTVTEHPNVRAFPIHPGAIFTDLARGTGIPAELFPDKLELASALILHLAAGKADWLSGRCVPFPTYSQYRFLLMLPRSFVSACWDITELERDWKEKVLRKGALVNRLFLPE
jgi:hypothetical protein